MNRSTRPTSDSTGRFAHDGFTAFALAAGLGFGHIVTAMAELGAASAATLPAAIVFAAAAAASTVCVLAHLAALRGEPALRTRIGRWVAAIGLGFAGAVLPGVL